MAGGLLLDIVLPLASAGRGGRSRRGRGSRLGRGAVVVVDSPHVVPEVPLSGEAVSRLGALASFIGAEVWFLTVTVHGVGLTLMAEQAGGGGKTGILASLNLAPVGLQMRIHKFAVIHGLVSGAKTKRADAWRKTYS